MVSSNPNDRLLELHRTMLRCSQWEQRLLQMIEEGQVSGYYHAGRGQEAVQVGAVAALGRDDYMLYGHRGCGYQVARGVPLEQMFAEFLGYVEGPSGGLGAGTIHIASDELGLLGQAGGLGGTYALAVGAALSAQQRGTDQIALCMFGEGTANRGTWHEAANAASIWKLGVVWLCENNGWSISGPFTELSSVTSIADRASAYGMPGVKVDGQDPIAVYHAVAAAVARARAGEGPTLIEAMTHRFRGHYEGDAQRYRDKEITNQARRDRDPLILAHNKLIELGLATEADLAEMAEDVAKEVAAAANTALGGTKPDPDRIYRGIYAGEDA